MILGDIFIIYSYEVKYENLKKSKLIRKLVKHLPFTLLESLKI